MYPKFLYKNHRSLTLYFCSLVSIAMPIFCNYMIFSDFQSFKTEFSSDFSAYCWTAFMIILAHSIFLVMIWLSGKYLLEIKQIDNDWIQIKTWSIIGFHKTTTEPIDILKKQKYNSGYSKFQGAPAVNAPYLTLRTTKGKKLIVDLKAEFFDTFKPL